MSTVEVEIPACAEPTYNFVSFLALSNKWCDIFLDFVAELARRVWRDRISGSVAGGWRGWFATDFVVLSQVVGGAWLRQDCGKCRKSCVAVGVVVVRGM